MSSRNTHGLYYGVNHAKPHPAKLLLKILISIAFVLLVNMALSH